MYSRDTFRDWLDIHGTATAPFRSIGQEFVFTPDSSLAFEHCARRPARSKVDADGPLALGVGGPLAGLGRRSVDNERVLAYSFMTTSGAGAYCRLASAAGIAGNWEQRRADSAIDGVPNLGGRSSSVVGVLVCVQMAAGL